MCANIGFVYLFTKVLHILTVYSLEILCNTCVREYIRRGGSYSGDALHHVLDVRADSAHSCQLFLDAKPFLNFESFRAGFHDIDGHVTEIPLERTSRSGDGHNTGLDTQIY